MDNKPTDTEKTSDDNVPPQQQNTTNVDDNQLQSKVVEVPQPQASAAPSQPNVNQAISHDYKYMQITILCISVFIFLGFGLIASGIFNPLTFSFNFNNQPLEPENHVLDGIDEPVNSDDTPKDIVDETVLPSRTTTGDNFYCEIGTDNNAYCKGENKYGQLGDGTETSSAELVAVYTGGVLRNKTIKSIVAGHSYACVIASDDLAYCWGANGSGNLGNKSNWGSSYPVAVYTGGVLKGKTIKQISAGSGHTCAIASDNQAYCWGYNSYDGRLGNNSELESNVPVAVDTSGVLNGKTIKTISLGRFNTCAIASDDLAYCWGDGHYGLLGNNTLTFSHVPVAVYKDGALKGKTIKSIETYPFGELNTGHVCVIASDNKKYCWGHDENGAEKLGQYRYNAVPVLE